MLAPLVSVVIPCYNHEQFIQDCIQSVIDQTYENIELIIIDDGSKDSSVEKIQEMIPACKQRFVRFEFRYRPNKGLSATLNEALEWCEGGYYFPLASDDIIYATIIAKEVSFLEENIEYGMCHTHAESIYFNPNNDNAKVEQQEITFRKLLNKNVIFAPTAMIRMSVICKLNGFDESLYMEDWDLWLRILDAGHKIGFINETLAFYREHENNSYKQHDKIEKASDLILNKWKNTPYYDEALNSEMLRRFCFYSEVDKFRAVKYINYAKKNINSRQVIYGFLKLIIPQIGINFIRQVRGKLK